MRYQHSFVASFSAICSRRARPAFSFISLPWYFCQIARAVFPLELLFFLLPCVYSSVLSYIRSLYAWVVGVGLTFFSLVLLSRQRGRLTACAPETVFDEVKKVFPSLPSRRRLFFLRHESIEKTWKSKARRKGRKQAEFITFTGSFSERFFFSLFR